MLTQRGNQNTGYFRTTIKRDDSKLDLMLGLSNGVCSVGFCLDTPLHCTKHITKAWVNDEGETVTKSVTKRI